MVRSSRKGHLVVRAGNQVIAYVSPWAGKFLFLCERVSMFKKVVFASAPLALLGGFAVAGTAHAATLTYSDTSVSIADHTTPVVDEFTGITATSTTDLTPGTSLTLTAAGNALGTLKWTNATAVSGTDTATLPVPTSGNSVSVAVTDGAAAASVTIVAAANATTTSNVDLTLT